MRNHADPASSSRALVTLAKQLGDGPLHELTELHRKATLLSCEPANDQERLQQLMELALVSLAAMKNFHAFTRELRAQIAALATTPSHDLH